jgi:hypothetical protein
MKSGYSILPIMEASSPAVVFDPSRPVDPEQVLHVLAAVQDALAWPSLPRLEFIIVDDRQSSMRSTITMPASALSPCSIRPVMAGLPSEQSCSASDVSFTTCG